MLSGTLVCYLMLKELDKNGGKINIPMLYIHRYLRLTGVYAFLIFYFASVHRFFELGPTHYNSIDIGCRSSSVWVNFLYINNMFYDDLDYPEAGQVISKKYNAI